MDLIGLGKTSEIIARALGALRGQKGPMCSMLTVISKLFYF